MTTNKSDIETITAAQVQVMAKLVELGETKAAHNLGKQLVAQLQESPSGGTPSAEALPSESAEVTEVVADKRDEITSILEDKGSTMKTISNEEIEILSTLVDLGHKDEALKLAQGLAERSSGDQDKIVAPEEKTARRGPEWSRDVDVAAKRSYQYLKSTLKGVESIRWSRLHGGDRNQISEGAYFDIAFEDGRDVTLDLSVVDNSYAERYVSTTNMMEDATKGYMKELESGESFADALKNIRSLWAWVGDGRKLKEGGSKTSDGDQDIVELVAAGKFDEALQKLTADSEETPKAKEARWAPDWAKDVERAAMRSYQYLKKTLKGLEDITYDFSGGASNKSGHSQIAYIYPTFEDGRSIILELVVTDHEYGDITVTTNNMLDYDPKGFSKELEYEEDIPKTLKNIRALWAWVGDGRKLKEGQVSDDKTRDIIALLGEGKTGEAIREILSAKENPDNKKYAAADAVKLRKKVVDLETYLNHKILPLRTEFPSEGELIDNPKGYVKPMKKTLSLLEKIEDLVIDYNATDLFRV